MKLEVGGVTDSVTVTAEGALLQTETASRGMNVDSRLVTDLPVANHNPMMLGQTLQGVYMRPLGAYTDPWTITSQFMINGGLMYLNEFQVDGAPNNAQFGNNVYGYSPPNEAVQEVSVQANSYDAQYGRTSGGVINVSTKSGANQFHARRLDLLETHRLERQQFSKQCHRAQRAPGAADPVGPAGGRSAQLPQDHSEIRPVQDVLPVLLGQIYTRSFPIR